MSLNQAVIETKYGDLEKTITAIAEGQVKMQETLTLFMASNSRPQPMSQPMSSILGTPQNVMRHSPGMVISNQNRQSSN